MTSPHAVATPSPPSSSMRETLRRLRSAQKPPATGSPAYSRFVNRRIGRVLAAASFHLGLTPNQVTAISAAFSAAAIAAMALAPPHPLTALLIAIGLLLGYAFDSADGQLARLRGGGTPAGEWLDHVVDSVKAAALHLAVLIGWFRFWDATQASPALLLLPIGFTLVSAVFFFVQILTDQLRRSRPDRAPKPADASLKAVLRSVAVAPTDYGLLCVLFVLFAWPPVFAVAYTLMLAGTVLFLLAALPKWYREMAALAR
ncbi:CDP-alcohol phosphatidyltransferase family protein [Pseudonocardia sp. WMMC193]|uniref:CDP-alcohol phosphatidyltransferase family protein n=1 Tax=Pseudonocardia sp. WMMC193 TaxID=2911965 RepID=UPI001F1CD14B|nr:CDP-alcohol phosphatidyltransferase family protein [Pseudonocardia sp. WMMC193]MCF7553839.1 CDP-alcohol phosphatidyltransferase family protein [Pseudonocardia sp. WMMC193]